MRDVLILALLAAALAQPARADVPARVAPVRELFVLHVDAGAPDTLRTALAAVSAAVRHRGGAVEQALVVADDAENPMASRLLERWKATVCEPDGVQRVVFVGRVSADARRLFVAALGHAQVLDVSGDAVAASGALAALSGTQRATLECPPDLDLATTALAAVAASVEGASLVFRAGAPAPASADLRRRVLAGTRVTTVCLVDEPAQLLPAALAAAHYRAIPLEIPAPLVATANAIDARSGPRATSPLKLDHAPRADAALRSAEQDAAARICGWLAAEGLDRPDALEPVMIFARLRAWGFRGLPLNFDRALVGSPLAPARAGALVGRLPLDAAENLALIGRTTLREALASGVRGQPRRRAVLSFVAYEANHAGPGSVGPFADSAGVPHVVNELLGAPGEPGVYPALKSAGFHITFNSGASEAIVGQSDPLESSPAVGFFRSLKDGATLFYDSSHGWYDSFFPFAHDRSINADVKFGEPGWPAARGRLDTLGLPCVAGELDQHLGDVHGLIAVFNACLVARGAIGPVLLRHGATAVLCAYTQVDSAGAGWWGIKTVEALARGAGVGEALAVGLAAASDIYPIGQVGADQTLKFVLMGDPHATLLR